MPITAVVYREGREVENLLASVSDDFNAAGLLLAGFVQRDRPRDDRHSCDMLLEDVATGAQISISEDGRRPGLQARCFRPFKSG